MADMNFGVNILPTTDLNFNLGSTTKRWNVIGQFTPSNGVNGGIGFYDGTNLNFTSAGPAGQVLIGQGDNTAPVWYAGLTLGTDATSTYKADFSGAVYVTGDITHSGNILPLATGKTLGAAKAPYSALYLGISTTGIIFETNSIASSITYGSISATTSGIKIQANNTANKGIYIYPGSVYPITDNSMSLGSTSFCFLNGYFSSNVYSETLYLDVDKVHKAHMTWNNTDSSIDFIFD